MGSGESVEATSGDTTLGVGYKLVSSDYFELLGINVLRGRLFAADERSPAARTPEFLKTKPLGGTQGPGTILKTSPPRSQM